ncbi:hypothetical protein GIB67_010815 [Kingdonia uniflora]|uniref:Uncharacterized protein n=1 Tax=Kingdonia uniflora TaxID=39325 RepID=A0A7J7L942_9MAGN|nr:hypothetical protein GIB67_010815 [Kingdonia uniflora]
MLRKAMSVLRVPSLIFALVVSLSRFSPVYLSLPPLDQPYLSWYSRHLGGNQLKHLKDHIAATPVFPFKDPNYVSNHGRSLSLKTCPLRTYISEARGPKNPSFLGNNIQIVAKTAGMHRNEWVENADRWVAGFLAMFEEGCHKMVSYNNASLSSFGFLLV